MTLPDHTRIAGDKTVAEWKDLKKCLCNCTEPRIWQEAFDDYFKTRLDSRYFKPIKALEKMESYDGEGFSIVTLHCSLIEFLATTLQGKTFRDAKKDELKDNEYGRGESKKIFVEFLQHHAPFNAMFSPKEAATDYYSNVRCGLLHEAQTRGGWRIRVCPSANIAIDVSNKIVYRDKMQGAFDQFVSWYGKELSTDAKLQQAFIRKFDSLCGE